MTFNFLENLGLVSDAPFRNPNPFAVLGTTSFKCDAARIAKLQPQIGTVIFLSRETPLETNYITLGGLLAAANTMLLFTSSMQLVVVVAFFSLITFLL